MRSAYTYVRIPQITFPPPEKNTTPPFRLLVQILPELVGTISTINGDMIEQNDAIYIFPSAGELSLAITIEDYSLQQKYCSVVLPLAIFPVNRVVHHALSSNGFELFVDIHRSENGAPLFQAPLGLVGQFTPQQQIQSTPTITEPDEPPKIEPIPKPEQPKEEILQHEGAPQSKEEIPEVNFNEEEENPFEITPKPVQAIPAAVVIPIVASAPPPIEQVKPPAEIPDPIVPQSTENSIVSQTIEDDGLPDVEPNPKSAPTSANPFVVDDDENSLPPIGLPDPTPQQQQQQQPTLQREDSFPEVTDICNIKGDTSQVTPDSDIDLNSIITAYTAVAAKAQQQQQQTNSQVPPPPAPAYQSAPPPPPPQVQPTAAMFPPPQQMVDPRRAYGGVPPPQQQQPPPQGRIPPQNNGYPANLQRSYDPRMQSPPPPPPQQQQQLPPGYQILQPGQPIPPGYQLAPPPPGYQVPPPGYMPQRPLMQGPPQRYPGYSYGRSH